MTYHSLTLNFDAEVDLFDCLSSIISQKDDLDGPIELEVVKHEKTLIIFPGQSGLSVEQFVRPGLHKAASKHKAAFFVSTPIFLKVKFVSNKYNERIVILTFLP